MDLPPVVSVRKFNEFNKHQKDELYDTILELRESLEEIPRKSLRKTLELTLAVLQYKGEQLDELLTAKQQQPTENDDESHTARLVDENEKLKRMLEHLEDEKQELKEKAKELTTEILQMQKRLEELAIQAAEGSDKESTDPLSELDKQEELLRNINTKNKHIKRLLKEIESLQNQNIEQSKTIIAVERELLSAKQQVSQLSEELTTVKGERKAFKDQVNELSIEIIRLEGNINFLEEEREKGEEVIQRLTDRLVSSTKELQRKSQDKEREVKRLKERLTKTAANGVDIDGGIESEPGEEPPSSDNPQGNDGVDAEKSRTSDLKRLQKVLDSRERHIKRLDKKLKEMATEMIASTKLMNRLSADKEAERNLQKPRPCCELIERSLQKSQKQCRELSDMLARTEEDNALKSQQAMAATNALSAYQQGEDGLKQTLHRCAKLEAKLIARDKQIHTQVAELNASSEVMSENRILRDRLHIPDDQFITSKHAVAKERRKDKMIDHLKMKMRASEEMRLKLKLEKSDLRKEILVLQRRLQQQEPEKRDETFSVNATSEIGEVPDSIKSVSIGEFGECDRGRRADNSSLQLIVDLQNKYEEIATENDILRMGMHEILEKLREYDEHSEHITIDSEILIRLLIILEKKPARTHDSPGEVRPRHSPGELRSPSLVIKATEHGDSDLSVMQDEVRSVQDFRDDSTLRNGDADNVSLNPNQPMDSSTRPTTPNRDLDESIVPIIDDNDAEFLSPDKRGVQQQISELRIYQARYEELRTLMADAGEVDKMQLHCGELAQRVTDLELEVERTKSSYTFMREDFDKCLTEAKQNELRHIQELADLRTNLHTEKQNLKHLQASYEAAVVNGGGACNGDEFLALQKTNAELACQLAYLVDNLLAGHIDQQYQIKDICADYGIVRDNLQLDYVSAEEYEKHLTDLSMAKSKEVECQRKIMQLEGLLEIAQQQIQSQQRLLNDITDNHINLRHLVADLQSNNEEKLLLAKMQRDLDTAQKEISHLRLERDEVQHANKMLYLDIASEKQNSSELNKLFHTEHTHKDIKIKFLLKSLLIVKEKYCKFTPLIFLTNFIYAYTKFVKTSQETLAQADSQHADVLGNLEDIIKGKLKDNNINESQCLIKLVKVETQCKLLEESNASIKRNYLTLQQEYNEQRIRFAQEAEHWHTIEALFATNREMSCATTATDDKVELPDDETDKLSQSLTGDRKHAATNTEAPPVPAERKKTTVRHFADKNTSPFTSPTKNTKASVCDNATQTTNNANARNESANDGASTKEMAKATTTTEAVVQTVLEPKKSQAVQTMAYDDEDGKLSDQMSGGESITTMQQLIEDREIRLKQTKEDLEKAMQKIKDLEEMIKAKKKTEENDQQQKNAAEQKANTQQSGIIEKTILSFHTLLTEKDKAISKFQDLLHDEREHNQTATAIYLGDIEGLKATVNNLNFTIKTKDMEVLELKTKLEVLSLRRNSKEKLDLATNALETEENVDNSLNELTDEKIEEMFHQDVPPTRPMHYQNVHEESRVADNEREKQDTESSKEVPDLLKQLKELKEKTAYWENTLKVKEDEIALLKEKYDKKEREKSVDTMANPEIEQLRLLLEEKDKHVNDLMETLRSFHDDQQRYIKDSSNSSADQITKLAADLTRTEATNKIYQTQVDALRRQLVSLTQREKQARESNQSLRTQLIKRPVVSIKTELNARAKTENLQKRIQQLDLDLDEARAQIQRQQVMLDAKRARSANEVGLWEKQKRYQQSAEKFKCKLEETEAALEKTRSLLQSARSTISRLEKDKHMSETKMGRGNVTTKCCRAPSCPNMQHNSATGGCTDASKYTQSDTPETYTGASSECSSPTISAAGCGSSPPNGQLYAGHHSELVEALKARTELQQRKILALELAGKGSNALTTELEKLHEKLSAIEAQNIRLEAKNLQMQLDNDLLRQGDTTERLQKRIKHLEDYIIALKEEIAQSEARRQLCKCNGMRATTQPAQSADQTILSLRSIVEKLRAENKYLKESRRTANDGGGHHGVALTASANCVSAKSSSELNKLQQMYAESLDKIAMLQIEFQTKSKCAICANREKQTENFNSDELIYIREQLKNKTQLLQKAKVLLTRAAAKEKLLKEQLTLWKRKCSELQNVPVIEETSE